MVIPATFQVDVEMDFLLRMYTETDTDSMLVLLRYYSDTSINLIIIMKSLDIMLVLLRSFSDTI